MIEVTEAKLMYETFSKVRGIVNKKLTAAMMAAYATTHTALLEILFKAILPESACDPATKVT